MNVFHACFSRVATVISIRNSSPPSWHKKIPQTVQSLRSMVNDLVLHFEFNRDSAR